MVHTHSLTCLEEINGKLVCSETGMKALYRREFKGKVRKPLFPTDVRIGTTSTGKPIIHPPVPFSARLYANVGHHADYTQNDHIEAAVALIGYGAKTVPHDYNAPPGHMIAPEYRPLNDALREASSWHKIRRERMQKAVSHSEYVKRSITDDVPGDAGRAGAFHIKIGDMRLRVEPRGSESTAVYGRRHFVVLGPSISRYGNVNEKSIASWGTVSFENDKPKSNIWLRVNRVRQYWSEIVEMIVSSGRRP